MKGSVLQESKSLYVWKSGRALEKFWQKAGEDVKITLSPKRLRVPFSFCPLATHKHYKIEKQYSRKTNNSGVQTAAHKGIRLERILG